MDELTVEEIKTVENAFKYIEDAEANPDDWFWDEDEPKRIVAKLKAQLAKAQAVRMIKGTEHTEEFDHRGKPDVCPEKKNEK